VSSAVIGNHLNNTPSQVRQDLSQFGSYGMQGYGYNIESLRASIHAILGTDATHTVIIAGIGSLGHALLEHLPLAANGYQILAGFDVDPKLMLMCGKVTHKNLIDNRPLFRYYSSIWIEKTSLIQYNKVSGRYLYEGKNTNH